MSRTHRGLLVFASVALVTLPLRPDWPQPPDARTARCGRASKARACRVARQWGAFCHILRPAWQNARQRKSLRAKELGSAPTILPPATTTCVLSS
jgi:hypothetical protein